MAPEQVVNSSAPGSVASEAGLHLARLTVRHPRFANASGALEPAAMTFVGPVEEVTMDDPKFVTADNIQPAFFERRGVGNVQ
jgi:hypothetical protein